MSYHSPKNLNVHIPEELIAQFPLKERGLSRLLVYDAANDSIRDDVFQNLPEYLKPGDCLVYNDSKVVHARLRGIKSGTGARLEFLLTQMLGCSEWLCLIRPARRVRPGVVVLFGQGTEAEVLERVEEGLFRVRFSKALDYKDLEQIGEIPLPKYIKRKPVREIDDAAYQTVYAKEYGAVASPTAGLHFTEKLIGEIRAKGVITVPVTLHTAWGTFRPVRENDYRKHKMHRESYKITGHAADEINRCIEERRRILCVGTTSVRAVETAYRNGLVESGEGETELFIYPGYAFRVVKGIVTNFHMPDSTLILLVAAFSSPEKIEELYNHAVALRYRFFSYGDAMFIF